MNLWSNLSNSPLFYRFDPRSPEAGMKRSQSVNSLTEETPGSPKPVLRKKNKPVAPTPPTEKPPRPAAMSATVTATATLPRPAKKPLHTKVGGPLDLCNSRE